MPGEVLVLRADPTSVESRVPMREGIRSRVEAATVSANIEVTYNGFPSEARDAFQRAVDIAASMISSPVTIRIDANWTPLEPGVLGSAAAAGYVRFLSGPIAHIWFPRALFDSLSGSDRNPGDPDIVANFNSDFTNWYLGTDGNAAPNDYDLTTVVLHEIIHGLGFSDSFFALGNLGFVGILGSPFIYDLWVVDGSGAPLAALPDGSLSLGTALTSGNLYFDGPGTVESNGGTLPRLYAPFPFESGSSIAHFDEATYPAGHADSLMTPFLAMGEAIHDPGLATCVLSDIGWDAQCASAYGCVADDDTLCLLDGRFQVEVDWRDFQERTGRGQVSNADLPGDSSGLFYFFNASNIEMLFKMVDTCGSQFDNFWVFFAATTNVEFTVTVTDLAVGLTKVWTNDLGHSADAVTDTGAFSTCP